MSLEPAARFVILPGPMVPVIAGSLRQDSRAGLRGVAGVPAAAPKS